MSKLDSILLSLIDKILHTKGENFLAAINQLLSTEELSPEEIEMIKLGLNDEM